MKVWNLRSFHATKDKNRRKSTYKIQVLSITLLVVLMFSGCDSILSGIRNNSGDKKSVNTAELSNAEENDVQLSDDAGSNESSEDSIIDRIEKEDSEEVSVDETHDFSEDFDISVDEYVDDSDDGEDSGIDISEDVKSVNHNNGQSYAYTRLNTSQKQTYSEILVILDSMYENVALTTVDSDEVERVFDCVMEDHPELFYVKGFTLGKYKLGNKVTKILFSGDYTIDKSDLKQKRAEIEDYISNVIYNAPSGDDYSKIKYVYEYLINNNTYDLECENNQNILSVIENGRTVCSGYAKTMQLLLNRMGIFCTVVNGTACGSGNSNKWESHIWNIVGCNGEYYNVDTTWGDSAFSLSDMNGEGADGIDINYEYLLVRDEDIEATHRAKPAVEMPVCNSLTDNYYVREGYYFEAVDEAQLQDVFERSYAEGKSNVFLKAADSKIYDDLYEHLITDQYIFECVSQNNVMYALYPERNMMLIRL